MDVVMTHLPVHSFAMFLASHTITSLVPMCTYGVQHQWFRNIPKINYNNKIQARRFDYSKDAAFPTMYATLVRGP